MSKNSRKSKSGINRYGPPFRVPRGLPNAGRFVGEDVFRRFYFEAAEERRAAERRERRAAQARERRARAKLNTPQIKWARAGDDITSTGELRQLLGGWGSTSFSRMKKGVSYDVHGVYRIYATRDSDLRAKLNKMNSDNRDIKNAVGRYVVTVTPFIGSFQKEDFLALLASNPDLHHDIMKDLYDLEQKDYDFLGYFYNKDTLK